MSNAKARFREAQTLDEAVKLLTAKQPKSMKMFRGKKKLWDEGVYESVEECSMDQRKRIRMAPKVSLATVKWTEGK